ncbi:hypothetical protein D030_1129B, partial [Vibrio parahaemolyticus AQ3810]
TFEVVVKVNE